MQLPLWKKALSFLTPVSLWKGSSPVNPVLELFLFHGRYQLATLDALYSDGDRYRPLVAGLGVVKPYLKNLESVLVLGAGLGSAVDVLRRFGAHPRVTLVELDEAVADLARSLLRPEDQKRVHIVVDDAQAFIQTVSSRYDAVIVDVFTGRTPLPFVTGNAFLKSCKQSIASGGIFLLNYMLNDGAPPWSEILARIEAVFQGCRVLALGPNRVVVWEDAIPNTEL